MTLVRMWEAEAKFGRAAELIRWLHDVVLPAALAEPHCLGAEGFAGDDDHRVVLITRWSDLEAFEDWDEGHHPALHRSNTWTFVPLEQARAQIGER